MTYTVGSASPHFVRSTAVPQPPLNPAGVVHSHPSIVPFIDSQSQLQPQNNAHYSQRFDGACSEPTLHHPPSHLSIHYPSCGSPYSPRNVPAHPDQHHHYSYPTPTAAVPTAPMSASHKRPSTYGSFASPPLSAPAFHGPHYHNHVSSTENGGSKAEERENRRRISHSAMERRRRERTNNIINELKELIPWLRNESRMQKLEVLEQCVCYIKELQQQQQTGTQSEAITANSCSSPSKRQRTDGGYQSCSPISEEENVSDEHNSQKEVTPASDGLASSPHALPLPQNRSSRSPQTKTSPDTTTTTITDAAIVSIPRPSRASSPSNSQEAALSAPAISSAHMVSSITHTANSNGDGRANYSHNTEFWGTMAGISVDADPASDLPELVSSDSGVSSKASSTVSTITPFRGPLPKGIADSLGKPAAVTSAAEIIASPSVAIADEHVRRGAKSSIEFLMS
ncbi:hypothetical protein GGI25_000746 [Coemansia spiralis]|uniref:BHLH domain-containing protein n=2 Tax=Coemansia TaxID=4863 RepID=A0A9W8G728_9FUNG|nr:hypothetical protein EDC05_000702 [Coemansia umbellata]KAJ2621963.1 hypothetical protein GGI26_003667 [Coemansia sp. RSA 1358]KAJ2680454.1 hypothetical protein GGI25_000746 [Coemansia spiralis]